MKKTKSQTATEYLIILAVVIIIALIVVGVMGGFRSFDGQMNSTKQKIIDRSTYGVDEGIFEFLPAPPEDFWFLKQQFEQGHIEPKRYDMLNSTVFLQPELYPNFVLSGLAWYRNPPEGRWGVYGYGCYPQQQGFAIATDVGIGSEFYAKTFCHTAYGISTWQGVKLSSDMSQSASEYFDVIIDPDQFLFEPTYPKFSKGWAKEIRYIVSVKKSPIPKGRYLFWFNVGSPDGVHNEEWRWSLRNLYVEGGQYGTEQNSFEFVLNVN